MAAGHSRWALIGLTVLMVGGCQEPREGTWDPFSRNLVSGVQRVTDSLTLGFVGGDGLVDAEQLDQARRFIAGLPDPQRVRVAVTGIQEDPREPERLTGDLVDLLIAGGILRNHITVIPRPGPVTLETEYFVVAAPPCPDEDDDQGVAQAARTPGCTILQNFVLMVADPADLVGRGSTGPAAADTPVGAITRYRTDKVKDLLANAIKSSSSQ